MGRQQDFKYTVTPPPHSFGTPPPSEPSRRITVTGYLTILTSLSVQGHRNCCSTAQAGEHVLLFPGTGKWAHDQRVAGLEIPAGLPSELRGQQVQFPQVVPRPHTGSAARPAPGHPLHGPVTAPRDVDLNARTSGTS